MTLLAQQPSQLDLTGVASDPFGLELVFTITDEESNPVDWSLVTNPTVVLDSGTNASLDAAVPSVTSPEDGQLSISWTTDQTTLIGPLTAKWALSVTIDGTGPLSILAGTITMSDPTDAGTSGPTSAAVTVSVGTMTANVAVTLGSVGGSSGGGSVNSVTATAGAHITVDNSDPANPKIGVTSGSFDTSGAAATAQTNAETFATSAVATETTRAEGAESTLTTAVAAKYTKPGTGIPETDLATALSTKIDAAATATALATEVSRAEAAEALLAPLASPALTGTPTAPTKTALTNNTDIATTAYADAAVAVETSRAGTAEALLAPKASPALTGSPTAPTQAALDNTTKIATTAYADGAVGVETTRAEGAESTLTTSVGAKYTKPGGGIPETDLTAALQTKIDGAATATTGSLIFLHTVCR